MKRRVAGLAKTAIRFSRGLGKAVTEDLSDEP